MKAKIKNKYLIIIQFFVMILNFQDLFSSKKKFVHKVNSGLPEWQIDWNTRGALYQKQYPNRPVLAEKKIVVVIASYNNAQWYLYNLSSVFQQNYSNYEVVYINDCSDDMTEELVKDFVQNHNQNDRTTLINNNKNQGQLANYYRAIHTCDDNAIVLQLDGDDFLAHKYVLEHINWLYSCYDIWITYGSYIRWPENISIKSQAPSNTILSTGSWRSAQKGPRHLRTFYAWLFKLIKLDRSSFKS